MDVYNRNKAIWRQDSKKNSHIYYIIDLSSVTGPRHMTQNGYRRTQRNGLVKIGIFFQICA